jgi:ketosteroid isomerase-like protein
MAYDLVFVERGSAAWDRVWALLTAETGGDLAQTCACCGESWQYMGSYSDGGQTAHEFRHRHCPTTGKREYRRYTDNDIAPAPVEAERGEAGELRPVSALLTPQASALVQLLTERKD